MALTIPYAEELDTCLRCGYCRPVCPTWREVGWESASPRGKAFWLRRMARQTPLDRALGLGARPTERFFNHLYYCTMCGMCAEVCHTSIPLPRVWESTREWLLRSGWGPTEGHAAMLGSLVAFLPAALLLILFLIRTALEDRTLQSELEGYRQYAKQVRYRLVPGVW